jgi:hypothetical protein
MEASAESNVNYGMVIYEPKRGSNFSDRMASVILLSIFFREKKSHKKYNRLIK